MAHNQWEKAATALSNNNNSNKSKSVFQCRSGNENQVNSNWMNISSYGEVLWSRAHDINVNIASIVGLFSSFPLLPVLALFILQSSLLRCYLRSSTSPEHICIWKHLTQGSCFMLLGYSLFTLFTQRITCYSWVKFFSGVQFSLQILSLNGISFDHFLPTVEFFNSVTSSVFFSYSYFKFQFRFTSWGLFEDE